MTGEPDPHRDPPPTTPAEDGGAEDSRAEQVLSQALRLMAGDGKGTTPSGGDPRSGGGEVGRSRLRRLTTGQLLLLAAIIGLLIGIGAGLISLLF